MKRELLKLLVVIAAAVGLAAGVDRYLISNDKTVPELVRNLKEMAVSLVASEDVREGDTSVVPADLEGSDQESQAGSEDEAEEETSASESTDTMGSQTETEQSLSGTEESEKTLSEEEAPPDSETAGTEDTQQSPADIGDGRKPSDENRDMDWTDSSADAYQIEDFEIIYQRPELPTGCEVVALTWCCITMDLM